MRWLPLLLLALATGCAFGLTHGTTKVTAPDGKVTKTMHHGWNMVIGQGTTAAQIASEGSNLNTANTGFSNNAAPTFEAVGVAAGKGFSAASGSGGINVLADTLAEKAKDDTE